MTSPQTAIRTSAIAKSYGSTVALAPTSLAIPAGSIFALLGHNGAGKTTLIKLLMNILHPSSGAASVLNRPSASLGGDDFTQVGYVSENQELPGWMTVRSFLQYQSGFYPQWDDTALTRRFELPLNRKLKHLSRGQRMKVALASVLAFRPALIVLDEPFSGLDPLVRDELIEALLDLSAEQATAGAQPPTILLSSHDLAEIESFCTHVAFLHAGSLLFAEDMPTLTARFREVTVTLAEPGGPSVPQHGTGGKPPLPGAPSSPMASSSARVGEPDTNFPSAWLLPRFIAHTLSFVHTQANTADIATEVRTFLPAATAIDIEPMNLRSIFLAIAKSGRAVEASHTDGSRA